MCMRERKIFFHLLWYEGVQECTRVYEGVQGCVCVHVRACIMRPKKIFLTFFKKTIDR